MKKEKSEFAILIPRKLNHRSIIKWRIQSIFSIFKNFIKNLDRTRTTIVCLLFVLNFVDCECTIEGSLNNDGVGVVGGTRFSQSHTTRPREKQREKNRCTHSSRVLVFLFRISFYIFFSHIFFVIFYARIQKRSLARNWKPREIRILLVIARTPVSLSSIRAKIKRA